MKKSLLFIMMFLPTMVLGQTSAEILAHFEKAVNYGFSRITNGAFSEISDASLIEAVITVGAESDEHGGYTVKRNFIKTGNDLKPAPEFEQLPGMPEFAGLIKKDFTLKTDEDALVFQTALALFSPENHGMFKRDGKWYFVRQNHQFYGKSVVEVAVNETGNIVSTQVVSEIEIPESLKLVEQVKDYPAFAATDITDTEIEQIRKSIEDSRAFQLQVEEQNTKALSRISAAKLFQLVLVTKEEHGDSTRQIQVVAHDKNVLTARDIFTTELFRNSIKKDFALNSDADIRLFEEMLEELNPADNKAEVKSYKKNEFWIFVRSISFGEENAFVVRIDDQNKIVNISYGGTSEKDLLRARMQSPDFKADYGFKLLEPANARLSITEGAPVEVKIEFNNAPVNAAGGWIMTSYKDQMISMHAGSDVTSPFCSTIPAEMLKTGSHVVDYILMPPGNDISKALARVSVEIEVLPFKRDGIDFGFELLSPQQSKASIKGGEQVEISIKYNEQNISGVWVVFEINGNEIGRRPMTGDMKSPFVNPVSSDDLNKGSNFVTHYFIGPDGDKQNPLAVFRVDVEVK